MIVNKNALTLKNIVAKEKENFGLSHLKVEKDRVIATDGKILIELKNPNQDLLSEYPSIYENSTEEPILLSQKTIEKINKNLPKKPKLSILENFIIGKQKEGEKENIVIFITDLENTIKIEQCNTEDINYPNTDKVYPNEGNKFLSVRLNIDLLQKLITTLKEFSNGEYNGVDLSFYTDYVNDGQYEGGIKIEFNNPDKNIEVKGIIMPMRK